MTFSGAVELLDNRDLGSGNFLAVFDAPDIAGEIRPAQFVMVRVREGSDPMLGRPFSVAGVGRGSRGSNLELLYKVVGRGTALLAELRPGARVGMVGPLGRPFPEPPANAGPIFMVAGGIGIAPFPYLARELLRQGSSPTLIYGARGAGDLIGLELFPEEQLEIRLATDDGSAGHHGFVTELLERELAALAPEERSRSVSYVCGPTPMMTAADAALQRHQAAGHFSMEAFMGCGFGVCLSCVIPVKDASGRLQGYRRTCVDGPTFPAGTIHWPGSVTP
jgi:dihydroorotate dehydrogenase electron transfer subunit